MNMKDIRTLANFTDDSDPHAVAIHNTCIEIVMITERLKQLSAVIKQRMTTVEHDIENCPTHINGLGELQSMAVEYDVKCGRLHAYLDALQTLDTMYAMVKPK